MYVGAETSVEEICYEESHVQKVIAEIRNNFDGYFQGFVETLANERVSDKKILAMGKKLGISNVPKSHSNNLGRNYKDIIATSIDAFEKDRKSYLDIFDIELLEEYQEDDPDTFKSKVLRNECPIIRKTLANKRAKELDKYRANFRTVAADWLVEVVYNLCDFSNTYADNYNPSIYESLTKYQDLEMDVLDTDDYTVNGVIGGGIKTHMLFKVNPELFSNRSRSAIWALWYLTDKKTFGCKMDSEFLMIDIKRSITQQNYFYPYELFHYYAFELYKILKNKAVDLEAYINPNYRYVIVDSFLDYVADVHDDEISFLKSQIRDGGMGYV